MERQIRIEIEPAWDHIETARARASAFLSQHGLARAELDALEMVLCELLENAVKYGFYRGATRTVAAALTVEPTRVTVEVQSPLESIDAEALTRLDRTIQSIRGYQDPFEAYLARLREVSAQRIDHHESGLGLVRIAYEGRSVLDFYVDERGTLAISAVYPRDDEGSIEGTHERARA